MFNSLSPLGWGDLVLMMAAGEAHTWVKVGEAVWAWMTLIHRRPLSLTMLSANNSLTITAMLGLFSPKHRTVLLLSVSVAKLVNVLD